LTDTMRYLILLLVLSAVVINAKTEVSKNIVAKQRAALRSAKDRDAKKIISDSHSDSDSDSDSNSDTKTQQKTFTIIDVAGDEKCVAGGGYCAHDEPLQCFGDVAKTAGLCNGDRVCCVPKKCLASRRFGICKPAGNCKLHEGEQAVAEVCGPDTNNFECCLHPVFDVPTDTGKTVEAQDCGVFIGSNIFTYIGNSGPLEVVKIHRELLVDGSLYDKDPTEADITLTVGAACALGSLSASAELQGMSSPITPTPTPATPETPTTHADVPPGPVNNNPPPPPPPQVEPVPAPAPSTETPAPTVTETPPTPPPAPAVSFIEEEPTETPSAPSKSLQLKVVRGFQTMMHQQFLYDCYQSKLPCYDQKDPVPSYPGFSLFGNGNVVEITATAEGLKWVADNIGYYGFRITQFPNVYQWLPSQQ